MKIAAAAFALALALRGRSPWLCASVVAVAILTNDSVRDLVPIPHAGSSALLGLAATAGAVVVSVGAGRRASFARWQRVALVTANVVAVVAALNLFLDYEFIRQAVVAGAPKYMEWYGAFGIIVTLVWLYLEILRLLSLLRQ